jgi:hypothetical protein
VVEIFHGANRGTLLSLIKQSGGYLSLSQQSGEILSEGNTVFYRSRKEDTGIIVQVFVGCCIILIGNKEVTPERILRAVTLNIHMKHSRISTVCPSIHLAFICYCKPVGDADADVKANFDSTHPEVCPLVHLPIHRLNTTIKSTPTLMPMPTITPMLMPNQQQPSRGLLIARLLRANFWLQMTQSCQYPIYTFVNNLLIVRTKPQEY